MRTAGRHLQRNDGLRVLVSWIAVNNDPFERQWPESGYRLADGKPVPGPTLTVLLDEDSPFAGTISDVVLLHRKTTSAEHERERRAVEETTKVLRERLPELGLHHVPWHGDDPTDHRAIFEFLREKMPELRRQFSDRELVIHISPGTPSMQTIWVLMAETGFVEPPFVLVKSYRRTERRGRPAVAPVELGIETFYKVYRAARPRHVASEEQGVVWDPGKFRTEQMRRLYEEARRFASLNVPILLLGERGTGKTMLASWIRLHSPFRQEAQDDRWPAVACGQYSPETMRAELFGYRKGAFTGATSDREGLVVEGHHPGRPAGRDEPVASGAILLRPPFHIGASRGGSAPGDHNALGGGGAGPVRRGRQTAHSTERMVRRHRKPLRNDDGLRGQDLRSLACDGVSGAPGGVQRERDATAPRHLLQRSPMRVQGSEAQAPRLREKGDRLSRFQGEGRPRTRF